MAKDTWIHPVEKKSLSKIVMESIKEGIFDGTLKPGEFLPSEPELAEKFGVGKSSVREAIKMLEAMGFVEICKGNGSKIRDTIDPNVINPLAFQLILAGADNSGSLVEFRVTIETMASCMAIDKATAEDLSQLRENLRKTKYKVSHGKSTLEEDLEFHKLMYRATHNEFIVIIGDTVMRLFNSSLQISNTQYSENVLSDHKKIFEALKNKNKEDMELYIKDSLSRWDTMALRK